jgi:superkiller protein 3
MQPASTPGHHGVGASHLYLREYQQAIDAIRKSLAIEPTNDRAYGVRGMALAAQGEHQSAEESYENGLKLKPENADLWNNLGELYVKIGRYQDAIEANEKALQLQPDLPDALHSLGLAHLKLSNTAAALAQCELLTVLDSVKARDLRDQISPHRQI